MITPLPLKKVYLTYIYSIVSIPNSCNLLDFLLLNLIPTSFSSHSQLNFNSNPFCLILPLTPPSPSPSSSSSPVLASLE